MKFSSKYILLGLALFVVASTVPAGTALAAPRVDTRAASGISDRTATMNGTLRADGISNSFWFEYGTTRSLGQVTSRTQALYATDQDIRVYNTVYGLAPNTTYYFRLVARGVGGEMDYGQTLSFTTGASPVGPQPTNPPVSAGAPTVVTLPASSVGRNGATLASQVNANGALSSVWFEYGRTASLGGVTTRDPAGSGNAAIAYQVTLRGLSAGTTYYYRVVSQNQYGVTRGEVLNFRTAAAPAPAPTGGNGAGGNDDDDDDNGGRNGGVAGAATSTPTDAPGCFNLNPTINASRLAAGQEFSYSLTYRNECDQTFSNATLQLTLPAATDFASTNYPFLSRDGNAITYSLGTIAPNFQGSVTVTGRVKEAVNDGENLPFEADIDFRDSRGQTFIASSDLSAVAVGALDTENGSSTLGASIGDALGGLFHSGWFWLVLFLVLIALFIFWLASRRRGDEEDEEEDEEEDQGGHGH